MKAQSEEHSTYGPDGGLNIPRRSDVDLRSKLANNSALNWPPAPGLSIERENDIITYAMRIMHGRLTSSKPGGVLSSPKDVHDYLKLRLAELEYEVFGALFLTARHALINDAQLFRGTLTQANVFPREVVKEALACNAAAAILYHNHPSGNPEASTADEVLTKALKAALALVDVRVLDHFIIARDADLFSFAERGLI